MLAFLSTSYSFGGSDTMVEVLVSRSKLDTKRDMMIRISKDPNQAVLAYQ